MKDAAGMRDPCPAVIGIPCGKKIAGLASGGITVKYSLCGLSLQRFRSSVTARFKVLPDHFSGSQ